MVKREDFPEGWWLEKGDPSVGIFGEEWHHEDCVVVQGPGSDEVKGVEEVASQASEPDHHGMVEVVYTLTCLDCGDEATFETEEFVGVPIDEEAA